MSDLNSTTQVYGIIGSPIKHSLSPLFQNHFIQQANLNAAYLPFHVDDSVLKEALTGLHAANIQGLNITVPYKERTLSLVDADSDALTIGAVNTLKRSQSGWKATNTDWQGFASVLQGLKADVAKTPVLLFGAGGTARAVCHALHSQGVKELWICNRSSERVTTLLRDLNTSYPDLKVQALAWDHEAVSKQVRLCRVMINTSSIGLDEQDSFPFALQGQGIAIDAVYKPSGNTAFCKAARAGGYLAVDGLPMLIAQGIASFKFWYQEELSAASFNLPDNLLSLQWVEKQLAREPLQLQGWEGDK